MISPFGDYLRVRAGRKAVLVMLAAFVALAPSSVLATIYRVGPNQTLREPSQASRLVASGDTVLIEPMPGGYYDCAVWHADNLTIEGVGPNVLMTDMTCQGKAIFVTRGRHITIRNLTFARARVRDWNGAGIRAEGADLRVEHVRFNNNESGILVADSPGSRILIKDSQFVANGVCGPNHCGGSIEVGRIAELDVINCRIKSSKGGDDIRSLAGQTNLIGDTITDNRKISTAYLVDLPDGGSLSMHNNTLKLTPLSMPPPALVRIMQGLGAQSVKTLAFSDNTLRDDTGHSVTFVLNWSGASAVMVHNHLSGGGTAVSSSGHLWFLIKSWIHFCIDKSKAIARLVRAHL